MDNPAEVLEEIVVRSGHATDHDSFREAAAYLNQKMSNKVHIRRWPGPSGPVVGPSLIVADLRKVAEGLAISGFMVPWIVGKIEEHLTGGGVFTNRGMSKSEDEMAMVSNGEVLSMSVRSEYRMATEKEVLDYADSASFANITGKAISRRSQEKAYSLHYHEGPELIAAYDGLPKQARVILDVLNESGREDLTEASIGVLLSENVERLKTKQDPMTVFGFYRRRLIDEGHLEES